MALSAGTRLGPYEIVALIGVGGMGEVYRATDPRMGRDVAIKISAERFSDRFSREVHAVAALNHPNICHLYDVGPDYLVMELVEGPTLAEKIKQGVVPLDEALGIAKQIADALEAAHEKGIVHRDLKPGNIKLRPDGTVKVLDFGLAKVVETAEAGSRAEHSPTVTLDAATRVGVILGTAAYMPPEQARGKAVDKRADIWAFGVVLYEMLTGERLFEGETVSDTLIEVATKEPNWERIPAKAQRLLRRCLEKDPKRRLRDIGDAMPLLEPLPGPVLEGGATQSAPTQRQWLWPGLAMVFVIAALGLGFIAYRHMTEETPVLKFSVSPPERVSIESGPVLSVSPDGRHVAFVARVDGKGLVWVRDLNSLAARPLPGTEEETGDPFWSPDSRFIAFFAGGKLKKIDVTGGPAVPLCDGTGAVGGTWGKNDVIVFAPNPTSILFRIPAAGGSATPVTALDKALSESAHRWPWFLPDGRHFLYTAYSSDQEKIAVYIGDLDSKDDLKTRRRVLAANSNAVYAPPGYLLFMREQTLMAQPFDVGKAVTTGDPAPIAEQVDYLGSLSQGQFSSSQNGVLAYIVAGAQANRQLTWFDREGKNLGPVGEPGIFQTPALSRDGKQAALSRRDSQSAARANLWLYDFTRAGASTRFTFDAYTDSFPVFSPDGSRIVFVSNRDGARNLYQKLTSGARNEEPLLKSDESKSPSGWSPDGRFLLYTVTSQKTRGDIWILPMEGSQKQPMLFQGTEFNESGAQFSPDGRWIAYQSDESGGYSGGYEVYVREFSLGSDGKLEATAKHQISTGGGRGPHWRDDGKELIYSSLDQRTVMSAEIVTTSGFHSSAAKALFQLPAGVSVPAVAVTGDGKRFLVAVPVSQIGPQQLTVVVNWQAGLKK